MGATTGPVFPTDVAREESRSSHILKKQKRLVLFQAVYLAEHPQESSGLPASNQQWATIIYLIRLRKVFPVCASLIITMA